MLNSLDLIPDRVAVHHEGRPDTDHENGHSDHHKSLDESSISGEMTQEPSMFIRL